MKTLATSMAIAAAAATAAIYHAGQTGDEPAALIVPGSWIVSETTLASYERGQSLALPESFSFEPVTELQVSEAENRVPPIR